jgi:hypothetical protein
MRGIDRLLNDLDWDPRPRAKMWIKLLEEEDRILEPGIAVVPVFMLLDPATQFLLSVHVTVIGKRGVLPALQGTSGLGRYLGMDGMLAP